jgi:hypothetical protein
MADDRSNPDVPFPAKRVALTALLVFAGPRAPASAARFPEVGRQLFPPYAVLAAKMLTPIGSGGGTCSRRRGQTGPHLQSEK